ncbi:MAG: CvpA family protein, partial [Gaiellales bacterium]
MAIADLLVLAWLALAAVSGFRRGLTAQVLSLGGLVLGAYAGSRVAPELLAGGPDSPWAELASIIGALVGALLLQLLAGFFAGTVRRLILPGPLRKADSAGGIFLGALTGLGIAWLIAVLALNQPAIGLQKHVQRSAILSTLVDEVPPSSVLRTLGAFDPLPLLTGLPDIRLPTPDPSVLASGAAQDAADAVVKVIGTSCGFG